LTFRPIALVLGSAWLISTGVGFHSLQRYASTPGRVASSPDRWPMDSQVRFDPARPTLVMAVHPRCPCTRASIEELAQIVTHCRGLVSVRVLVFQPKRFPEQWSQSDLWHQAEGIPGVQVLPDVDGREATRFGAKTSGHVFLYSTTGGLLYSGGITGARGHVGDNFGRGALISLLREEKCVGSGARVFGCPIGDE